ncbi:MAG: EamA family transporter, partial [Chloroflexota bacterium]
MALALLAILLWSFLAYFGATFDRLPSFLVVGVALVVGGLAGLPGWREWRVPWKTFLVGVGGIFGYHFLYFSAFRIAPAVEANLMNYLWPLLIVLLSPLLLPGYRLRAHHVLGALSGLAGAALIVSGGRLQLDLAYLPGYLMAAGAALIWALYSLLTKRLPPFSTHAVGGFCLASGLLSLGAFALAPQGFALRQLSWG